MTNTYRFALLPGDGIGPDVTEEAVKVLRAVEPQSDAAFEFTELSVGAGEYQRSALCKTVNILHVSGEDRVDHCLIFGFIAACF